MMGPSLSYRHKLHEEVAHMPMDPNPITLSSFSHPALAGSWGFLSAQLTEGGETQVCCTDYLAP